MIRDDDYLHGARALLGGRPLNIATDNLFEQREDQGYSARDLRIARRTFDALKIGIAVERVQRVENTRRMTALLHLARLVRPQLSEHSPGWFRFLLTLGAERGENMFQLSFARRPQSDTAQPKAAIKRQRDTSRAINDMVVAGAILTRFETANAAGDALTVQAAIELAINGGEIQTGEGAARKAWHRFQGDCKKLTNGCGTYRLEKYTGSVGKYHNRWVALPDKGSGVSQLPPATGGRPQKT